MELQRKDDLAASFEASAVVALSALKDSAGLAKAQ
jgi:hypothetical protein